jgi:hypothetical protein
LNFVGKRLQFRPTGVECGYRFAMALKDHGVSCSLEIGGKSAMSQRTVRFFMK